MRNFKFINLKNKSEKFRMSNNELMLYKKQLYDHFGNLCVHADDILNEIKELQELLQSRMREIEKSLQQAEDDRMNNDVPEMDALNRLH